jgi:hypothetical protein
VSDKPLDCVGIDPTRMNVGKHDFRAAVPILASQAERTALVQETTRQLMAARIRWTIDHAAVAKPAELRELVHYKLWAEVERLSN